MKRYRWLLGCCLFLSIGMLWAADEPDLRMLQQKAPDFITFLRHYIAHIGNQHVM